jgi:hypothetical protein
MTGLFRCYLSVFLFPYPDRYAPVSNKRMKGAQGAEYFYRDAGLGYAPSATYSVRRRLPQSACALRRPELS